MAKSLLLCLFAFCHIPNDYGKHFPSVGFCMRNGSLDGEFLACCPQTTQGLQIANCLLRPSFTQMTGLGIPCGSEPLRDEAMNQSPDRVARPACEHFFCGCVEHDNPLILVHDDDGVHGGLNDLL